MRSILGFLFILASYLLSSRIVGSPIWNHDDSENGSVLIIIIILTIANAYFIHRHDKRDAKLWGFWLFISVVPGNAFVFYARYSEHPSGLAPFPWDWGIWGFYVPVIFVFFQIATLLALIFGRKTNT